MDPKGSIGLMTLATLLMVRSIGLAQKDTGYLKVDASLGRTGVFVDGKYLGPAANFRVDRKYADARTAYRSSVRAAL